jgi:hypothetical protein
LILDVISRVAPRVIFRSKIYFSDFHELSPCVKSCSNFSILGVQFFGNKFYKCVNADGPIDNKYEDLQESGIWNKSQCIAKFGEEAWQNSKINFDNTIMAFFALYQVVSKVY